PPNPVNDCYVANVTLTALLLHCTAGDNGGLRQTFHLQVYNDDKHQLHTNLTSFESPVFHIKDLPPATDFTLNVYASNAKGKSDSIAINSATAHMPERHARKDGSNDVPISPIIGVLIGIIASLTSIQSHPRPPKPGTGSCYDAKGAGLFLFADNIVRPTQHSAIITPIVGHIGGHTLRAVNHIRLHLKRVHSVVEKPPESHVGVGLGVRITGDVHAFIAGHAVDNGLSGSAHRRDCTSLRKINTKITEYSAHYT
ncbi:unnamed protein product, partial [Medioppia subpectinata]